MLIAPSGAMGLGNLAALIRVGIDRMIIMSLGVLAMNDTYVWKSLASKADLLGP